MALTPSQQIAANLRVLMAEQDVTQGDLAPLLGVTQTQVSRRMSGLIPWRVTELTTIAAHLRVPLSALLPAEQVSA